MHVVNARNGTQSNTKNISIAEQKTEFKSMNICYECYDNDDLNDGSAFRFISFRFFSIIFFSFAVVNTFIHLGIAYGHGRYILQHTFILFSTSSREFSAKKNCLHVFVVCLSVCA